MIPDKIKIDDAVYINSNDLIRALRDHGLKVSKDVTNPTIKTAYLLAYSHILDLIVFYSGGESAYTSEVVKND